MAEPQRNRVAIVDDDPSYGRAVARLLRASGMETRTFGSAEDYLASNGEGAFDALLLDVELPGLSGFDLRRRLVSAGSGPAVVFISGHLEEAIALEAAGTGCLFVRKSDPGEVVLAALRRAVTGPGTGTERAR